MKSKDSFLSFLNSFFSPLIDNKKIVWKALIPITITSVVNIFIVYLIKEITNELTNSWNQDIVIKISILLIIIILNYLIIYFTRKWTHATIWPELRKYMYKKFIPKYLYLDNNYIEKQGTWRLIALTDKWIHSWIDLLNRFLEDVFPWIIMMIFSFIFIASINFYYAIALILLFSITFYITFVLQKIAKNLRLERKNVNIAQSRFFVKILMSKFEILQNDKWDEETQKLSESLNENKRINFKLRDLWVWTTILSKFIVDWSKVFILLVFWFWLFWWIINLWEFVALMSISYIFDQILNRFLFLYIDFTNIFVDVEKFWDFMDIAPKIKWFEEWKEFKFKNWEIKIKNLSFKYNKNYIFENFNLKIEAWKKLALVWPSWWWKTTLVKLLSAYIKQNSWEILIDWQNLWNLALKTYFKKIWYLTQDPSIFDWTIYENLTYAVEREISDKEIKRVLKESRCDFIYNYEKWIDTEIWERWIRLSWWQKQRLAIAKIMLKNPEIIFLDEPTSAMDSFNEEEITKALSNLFVWKTVIIIAHRLQTVKDADRIVYIENGKIIEDWTHQELIKLNWKYKKMLKLQSWF